MANDEIWKFGETTHKLYSENLKLINDVCETLKGNISGRYLNKGKEVGWDLVFDSKKLRTVNRLIKKYGK